uniref:Uncharacterized protein n=1 Tax=Glossina palpalis gambiensis TaxID=67801 RepID=A0A1B0BBY6_9MUSC
MGSRFECTNTTSSSSPSVVVVVSERQSNCKSGAVKTTGCLLPSCTLTLPYPFEVDALKQRAWEPFELDSTKSITCSVLFPLPPPDLLDEAEAEEDDVGEDPTTLVVVDFCFFKVAAEVVVVVLVVRVWANCTCSVSEETSSCGNAAGNGLDASTTHESTSLSDCVVCTEDVDATSSKRSLNETNDNDDDCSLRSLLLGARCRLAPLRQSISRRGSLSSSPLWPLTITLVHGVRRTLAVWDVAVSKECNDSVSKVEEASGISKPESLLSVTLAKWGVAGVDAANGSGGGGGGRDGAAAVATTGLVLQNFGLPYAAHSGVDVNGGVKAKEVVECAAVVMDVVDRAHYIEDKHVDDGDDVDVHAEVDRIDAVVLLFETSVMRIPSKMMPPHHQNLKYFFGVLSIVDLCFQAGNYEKETGIQILSTQIQKVALSIMYLCILLNISELFMCRKTILYYTLISCKFIKCTFLLFSVNASVVNIQYVMLQVVGYSYFRVREPFHFQEVIIRMFRKCIFQWTQHHNRARVKISIKMTSTELKVGLVTGRPSSRVLKPPGGGHSNIFAEAEVSVNAPRPKYNQQNSTNLNACLGSTDANEAVEKLREEIAQTKQAADTEQTKRFDTKEHNSQQMAENAINNNAGPKGRIPPGGHTSGGFW